jgi:uncharacterized protein YbjT (DUF2867 family)
MIAVTGATGTVGRELVRLLVAQGERPRILTRDVSLARRVFGAVADYAHADLDRPDTLPAALAGAERVFLLTPATSRQPAREHHLVAAAVTAGVGHLVKASVFRADEMSPLGIARQHGQTEALIARTRLDWTFLRPVFFMQNLTGQILNGQVVSAAGAGRVAMIDARDVAAAASAALTGPAPGGRVYTLTGPQAVTFDEVADLVSSTGPADCLHRRVAPQQVRDAMLRSGAERWFASDMARLHTMLADGYEEVVTPDVTWLTGRPGRDLPAFLHDMLATPETGGESRHLVGSGTSAAS